MTIGIYKLTFSNTDKVYIGQSLNIEKRFINHKSELRNGTSAKKLQTAYTTYGNPTLSILEVTDLDTIDSIEAFYINKYNSIDNGFNSVPGGLSTAFGQYNPAAKYDKSIYVNILKLLVDTSLTYMDIASKLNVGKSTVEKISSMQGHIWLKYECPELYSRLESLRANGTKSSIINTNVVKLISPDNIIYEVTNYTKFAKAHGLHSAGICHLVDGRYKTHKGWKLYSIEKSI